MSAKLDVERGPPSEKGITSLQTDTFMHQLEKSNATPPPISSRQADFYGVRHLILAFVLGASAVVFAYLSIHEGCNLFSVNPGTPRKADIYALASSEAGSTSAHHYPPPHPTNADPSLFPSNVGLPGGTPTGGEAAIIATAPAYPMNTGQCSHELIAPARLKSNTDDEDTAEVTRKKNFNIFQSWGSLSPWYSVKPGRFGVHSTAQAPESCRVTGLHLLHRHGARYPTAWVAQGTYGGPTKLATKLHKNLASWNASGSLRFLNDWTYKLGEELLTPFGRQQLYDLGISMRMKYGFLLENFTDTNTIPVFRTESQDRMLNSAINFALGFFGHPLDGKYQQSITLESYDKNFNNTLAPYMTCNNGKSAEKASRGQWYLKEWANRYLQNAQKRLQRHMHGLELTIDDVYTMQQLCPYETVALGYSKFCELFTEEEWKDFDYSQDLQYWYESSFGSPVALGQGIGYIHELIARLTHTPISTHNTTTNATLDDNPTTFPLNQSLYVDATHEVFVLNIITALNLTFLAKDGPLPYTYRPKQRAFRSSELVPFATNVQFQLLECTTRPDTQIRIIINDGVAPLTGIKGCPEQEDGMCPLSTFVEAQKQTIRETDWAYECCANWTVPEGPAWNTTSGSAPKQEHAFGKCTLNS